MEISQDFEIVDKKGGKITDLEMLEAFDTGEVMEIYLEYAEVPQLQTSFSKEISASVCISGVISFDTGRSSQEEEKISENLSEKSANS